MDESEISLEDLGKTYQRLLHGQSAGNEPVATNDQITPRDDEPLWSEEDDLSLHDHVPTTPEGILEAVLFVGHPKNRGLTAESLASLMRGVNSADIPNVAQRLNERYIRCRQSFRVIESDGCYRLSLEAELSEIRSVFAGRAQTVKLNQQAIDCLALIAYNPGITLEEIDSKWNRSASSIVRMLIRRNLVELKIEGKGKQAKRLHYTTNRFLNLVGLESLEDLPVAWD